MLLSAVSISKERLHILVKGIVQGVGFRPFVYTLAKRYSLNGFVYNGGEGVTIEVEGSSLDIESFFYALQNETPPLARIDTLERLHVECKDEEAFIIKASDTTHIETMLSSDIATCKHCLDEMQDPNDRRYNYPFINCTDCGPRYSIIKQLPYDRVYTSMADFEMCEECRAEYENPLSRRFHAQPISCYKCGPTLYMLNTQGEKIATDEEAMEEIVSLIKGGSTVAIKGLGGFHLVCDASNESAVQTLRINKNRPSKPLAVMFKDMDAIKKVAKLTDTEEKLIRSKERPIVVVTKKEQNSLADSIAPNIDRVGVFLPYTPLHVRLFKMLDTPLVATSANLSDEPIIIREEGILEKLSNVVSGILTHDRAIINASDDSVIMATKITPLMIRMARGYAPMSKTVPSKSVKKILAVGANQKNTLSILFDEHIITSPHIGDLNSLEAFEYFTRTLENFGQFYDFYPDIIVCDKHPNYETTKWAKQYAQIHDIELIEVQHHYAHTLACMAEFNLDEDVLAFSFDGTGYGDDGMLWGGEVLIADTKSYTRVHSFAPLRLLGADKAIKEPNRVGLSLLFDVYSLEEILVLENSCVKSFTSKEVETLHQMYQKGLNSPISSSVGRLFDGVLSLSSISQSVDYEGESGLLIEAQAVQNPTEEFYSYTINDNIIEYQEMIKQITLERDSSMIAMKFINTLARIVLDICELYPDLTPLFSGGVFQNRTLVEKITNALEKKNKKYYIQEKTAINDGAISLGQIYHAYALRGKE